TVSPCGSTHSESSSGDCGTTSIDVAGNCGSSCPACQCAVEAIEPGDPGTVTSTVSSMCPPGPAAPNLHSTVWPCSRTQSSSLGNAAMKDPEGISIRTSMSCRTTVPVLSNVVVSAATVPTVTGSGAPVSVVA